MTLRTRPVTRAEVRAYVAKHHSHHWPPNTYLLALGVELGPDLVCVAVLELPKARMLCNGRTAEVSRVASDGSTRNACSLALASITRAALAIGYRRLVSYLLLGERGSSYRAAGWWPVAISAGGFWNRPSRPSAQRETSQAGVKVRWECGPDAQPRDPELLARVDAAVGNVTLPARVSAEPLFAHAGRAS